MITSDVFVRIPVAARKAIVGPTPNLDKADSASRSRGDQAVAAEILGDRVIKAVMRTGAGGLAREVEHLRSTQLQLRCQLVAGNPSLEPRVTWALDFMCPIQAIQQR